MGNQQSQSSDEEERQASYRYHEDVLQNAQLLTNESGVDTNIPVYESENEEYFSAEEGDTESDRSITPPRTRPESSSGEDFSDDSIDEDEDEENERESSINIHTMAPPSNVSMPIPSPGGRVLRSNRTCGQCNVSRFQEHDSIGPELETSRWHLNDSSIVSNRSNAQSQNTPSTNELPLSVRRHKHYGTSSSPFIPIQSSPGSHNASQTSTGNTISFVKSLKRKMSQTPSADEKRVPPRKRYSNEVSPWKRGIGYFDSSDSDDDVDEVLRERGRSRHSRSPKSARMSKDPLAAPGSKRAAAEKLDASVENNSSSLTSPKQRRIMDKQALANAINSDSAKRSHSGEQLYCELRMKKLRGEVTELEERRENVNCENPTILNSGATANALHDNWERKQTRSGAFQTYTDAGDNGHVHEGDNPPTKTLKMGNNCVRNSQGKVLPIRGQSELNLKDDEGSGTETQIVSPNSQERSSLSNIIGNLRNGKRSAGENASTHQLKSKFNDRHSSQAIDDGILTSSQERRSHSNSTSGDQSSFNPLANVVLTPTTPTESSPGSIIPGTKRKRPSAADRLKKFWTDSSLGSNFKSIFSSKSKLIPESSSQKYSHQTPSPSSLPSTNVNQNQNCSNLFNDSTHMHFSSSPAESPTSRLVGAKSFSMKLRDTSSFPFLNLSRVSPIFASCSGKSPSETSMNRETRRYSSILEMSAKAQKRDSQSQNRSQSRTPTRTSPRLRHTSKNSALVTTVDMPSSAEIEILPQVSQFQVLHFKLDDTVDISVSMGDISEETCSGIVNWTDESLTHTVTECSRLIAAKAGALMRAGCSDYLTNKGAVLEAPDVLTTPAGGRLPKTVEALLHVVSIKLKRGEKLDHSMTTRLLEVYANCLRFANERLGLQSLSLPMIGQDLFTAEVSIRAFFDSVLIYLTENTTDSSEDSSMSIPFDLTSIHFVISDVINTDLAAEVIKDRLQSIADQGLKNVARDTFISYYSSHDSPRSSQTDSVDRAKSGRPRVKRPKL